MDAMDTTTEQAAALRHYRAKMAAFAAIMLIPANIAIIYYCGQCGKRIGGPFDRHDAHDICRCDPRRESK